MRAGAVKRVVIDEQAYTRLLVVRRDLEQCLADHCNRPLDDDDAVSHSRGRSLAFAVDLLATLIGPLESVMLAGPATGARDFPEWVVYSMRDDELRCTRCKGLELLRVRGRTLASLRLYASQHAGCLAPLAPEGGADV